MVVGTVGLGVVVGIIGFAILSENVGCTGLGVVTHGVRLAGLLTEGGTGVFVIPVPHAIVEFAQGLFTSTGSPIILFTC